MLLSTELLRVEGRELTMEHPVEALMCAEYC